MIYSYVENACKMLKLSGKRVLSQHMQCVELVVPLRKYRKYVKIFLTSSLMSVTYCSQLSSSPDIINLLREQQVFVLTEDKMMTP